MLPVSASGRARTVGTTSAGARTHVTEGLSCWPMISSSHEYGTTTKESPLVRPGIAERSSTTCISTPVIGVPIDPGLRGRSGLLNDATGEVSERP